MFAATRRLGPRLLGPWWPARCPPTVSNVARSVGPRLRGWVNGQPRCCAPICPATADANSALDQSRDAWVATGSVKSQRAARSLGRAAPIMRLHPAIRATHRSAWLLADRARHRMRPP